MALNNCILLLACSSIVVLSSTLPEQRLAPEGTIKVHQSCQRDSECIKHAFCEKQKICLCNPYYTPSRDMATCRITAGASCTDQEGCSTMTNAECSQDGCTCKANFIIDPTNSSNCIAHSSPHQNNQPAGPRPKDYTQPAGPRAQEPIEVSEPRSRDLVQVTGPRTQDHTHDHIQLAGSEPRTQYHTQLPGSEPRTFEDTSKCTCDCKDRTKAGPCINGRCTCDTDHRFVNETCTCVKMRGLNETCTQNYECFLDKMGSKALECKNGKCAEVKVNPTTKNGSPVHRPILMGLWTLIFGTTLRKLI